MTAIQLLTRRYITNEETKEIEYDSGEIPSKSFVFAFMQGLLACFRRVDSPAIPITGGAAGPMILWGHMGTELFRCDETIAGAGVTTVGTVIGSGTVAVATTDHVISSLIPHGIAAGQAEYAVQSIGTVQVLADRLDLVLSRNFRNSHTLDLIVRECGVYARAFSTPTPYTRSFMIIRDLITPVITLPPARILTIEYIIRAPL